MFLLVLLAFSSVLLASHASVPSTNADGPDPTTTFRGFSFSAKATPNSDKGSSDNHTLTNESDMEYTGKVNVGGHDFTLVIDTGSSDLWVIDDQKLKLDNTTSTTLNLTYGIGSAYGTIAYGPVSFGDYHVDAQALLVASKTTNQDAEGILGLGLDGLSAIERTTKNPNGASRSVIANAFAQHPTAPRLVGLALERSEDGEDTSGGYLTVGEYDPQFSDVAYAPKNPVSPPSTARWTIALDGMTVDGSGVGLHSGVQGAKKNQAIALIDSGTSLAYLPSDAVDAIYGRIDGSVHVKADGQDAWYVPCLGQVNVSFTFANVTYPINPMELTSPMRVIVQDDQYTVCVNAFRPPFDGLKDHDFDFLLGDVFMRNVYSVFNFGNVSTTDVNADAKSASIQFLSRTDRDRAYGEFQNKRRDALRAYPPLFDLTKLQTNGSTDGGGRLQPP